LTCFDKAATSQGCDGDGFIYFVEIVNEGFIELEYAIDVRRDICTPGKGSFSCYIIARECGEGSGDLIGISNVPS